MLLFRAEEHVDRWLQQWALKRGATLSIHQGWQLAHAWHRDRTEPHWRRSTLEEAEALLTKSASPARSGAFANSFLRRFSALRMLK